MAQRLSSPNATTTRTSGALLVIHEDDPTLGYRFLTDELADIGITAPENHVWQLCSTAGVFASHHRRKEKPASRIRKSTTICSQVVDENGPVRHEFGASAAKLRSK